MRARAIVIVTVLGVLSLGACGSSSKNGSGGSSPTTTNRNLSVDTPDGQVTVSLDGQLPPGWPSDFPLPTGAKPTGSGSLATDTHNVMIGVYTSAESSRDVFDFYKSSSSITVASSSSIGVGDAFIGTLKLGGDHAGSGIVVTPGGDGSYIVITLKPTESASTTSTSS